MLQMHFLGESGRVIILSERTGDLENEEEVLVELLCKGGVYYRESGIIACRLSCIISISTFQGRHRHP